MTNDELRTELQDSATSLHEMITAADGTNAFDTERPLPERVYALELSVSELSRDLGNVTKLIAQLALAIEATLGSQG